MNVKIILIYFLKTLGFILGIVVLYAILGYLLPFIEVSAKDDGEQKKFRFTFIPTVFIPIL